MDDKYDVYVVMVPALEGAYLKLSSVVDSIFDIAQDVDFETAENVSETVANLWRDIPDSGA